MPKIKAPSIGGNRSWKSIAIDVLAIAFSVLFALALDDWRARRDTQEKVEKVIETIRHEVSQNKQSVARALAYHEPMVENLQNGTHRLSSVSLKDRPMDFSSNAALEASLKEFLLGMRTMMFEEVHVLGSLASGFYAKLGNREVRLEVQGDTMHVYGEGNIQLRPANILNAAWETAIATQTTIHLDFELVAAMTELSQLHEVHNSTVGRIIDILYGSGGSITSAMQDLRWFEVQMLEKYEQIEGILG